MGRVTGAPSKMWLLVEGGQAGPSNLISGSRRANGKTHNGFSGLCTGALVNAIKKKKKKKEEEKKRPEQYTTAVAFLSLSFLQMLPLAALFHFIIINFKRCI